MCLTDNETLSPFRVIFLLRHPYLKSIIYVYCQCKDVSLFYEFAVFEMSGIGITITGTMVVIRTGRKDRHLNTLEKYHIYRISN
jgi:hypothetical protein